VRRALGLALGLSLVACAHAPYAPERADARAFHDSVATPSGQASFHAIPFPPRARTRPSRLPLVVVEPVLFRRELLLEDGGLVATFEDAGFPVWLVGSDADVPPDEKTWAAGVARSIGSVARESHAAHVDVLALGFAGPATLGALAELSAPSSPVAIDALALMGTPLDEAYPDSFAKRVRPVAGGPASALCALQSGAACANTFRDPRASSWLGSLPASGASDARSAERYPWLFAPSATSVLFVAGKIDGVAPTESIYPAYVAWGSSADRAAVKKRFFVAGLENGLGRDFDSFSLLELGDGASAVWSQLVGFFSE
jgi:hypothetical protein